MTQRAYIDIETTGLSIRRSQLTVVGVGIERSDGTVVRQLVGEACTGEALMDALGGVRRVYTYNGRRFDLPFIKHHLGIDVGRLCDHTDLMFVCWRRRLMGGLKNVERTLGIERAMPGICGLDAVRWWLQYVEAGDRAALDLLLSYNAEDVRNLKKLRHSLGVS